MSCVDASILVLCHPSFVVVVVVVVSSAVSLRDGGQLPSSARKKDFIKAATLYVE